MPSRAEAIRSLVWDLSLVIALESYAMKRFALILGVFLSVSVHPSNSQDNGDCSYIVKEVSFENSASAQPISFQRYAN